MVECESVDGGGIAAAFRALRLCLCSRNSRRITCHLVSHGVEDGVVDIVGGGGGIIIVVVEVVVVDGGDEVIEVVNVVIVVIVGGVKVIVVVGVIVVVTVVLEGGVGTHTGTYSINSTVSSIDTTSSHRQ